MEHDRTVSCDDKFFPRLESSSTDVQVGAPLEEYRNRIGLYPLAIPRSKSLFSTHRGRANPQLWNKSFTSWRSGLPNSFSRSVEPLVVCNCRGLDQQSLDGDDVRIRREPFLGIPIRCLGIWFRLNLRGFRKPSRNRQLIISGAGETFSDVACWRLS
jgi:hypothetical protein